MVGSRIAVIHGERLLSIGINSIIIDICLYKYRVMERNLNHGWNGCIGVLKEQAE